MSGTANQPKDSESSPRYIRWDDDEWAQVEEAAKRLGEQVHASIKPSDFVRGAAKKRVEEILGTPAAA